MAGREVLIHREGSRVIIEPVEPEWSADVLAMIETPCYFADAPRGRSRRTKPLL